MSIHGKKIWAICCGQCRQEYELFSTLEMLTDFRNKEYIEGIVLSTWIGEIDKVQGLREKLKSANIFIIENQELNPALNECLNLNYLRQALQLHSGLNQLPEDIFILKCRTDLSIDRLRWIIPMLKGDYDLSIDYGSRGLFPDIKFKIGVTRLPVDLLFCMTDIVFLGYKSDVRKMINFENVKLKYGFDIIPDYWFFINLFVRSGNIVEQIVLNLKQWFSNEFGEAIKAYARQHQFEQFYLPDALCALYAYYFLILYNYFVPFDPKVYRKKISNFYISDVFLGKKDIGMVKFWQNCFYNLESLRMIVEDECLSDATYSKIIKYINKVKKRPNLISFYNIDDYMLSELKDWWNTSLRLDIKKWFKDEKLSINSERQSILVCSEYQINLFDQNLKNTEDSDEWNYFMKKNLYGSRLLYSSLSREVDAIKKINPNIYESALGAAGRSEIPYILKKIALELNSQIVLDSKGEVSFIFERWKYNTNRFFKFPLSATRLSAYYQYCCYIERNDKSSDFPKVFYKAVINQLGYKEKKLSLYTDEIITLFSNYLENNFAKYHTDNIIKEIINFFADENLECKINKDVYSQIIEIIAMRKTYTRVRNNDKGVCSFILNLINQHKDLLDSFYLLNIVIDKLLNLEATQKKVYIEMLSNSSILNRLLRRELPINEMSDSDFVTLTKYYYGADTVSGNMEYLDKGCSSLYRTFIAEMFCNIELNDDIFYYLTLKNSCEIWINFRRIINTLIDTYLIPLRDNDGFFWPWGTDICSNSCFAAFFRIEESFVSFNFEFASADCLFKNNIIDKVNECFNKSLSPDTDINIIYSEKLVIDSKENLRSSVALLCDKCKDIENKILMLLKDVLYDDTNNITKCKISAS